MRSFVFALALLVTAGGCAGPVIDHIRPKEAIMAPELIRYGLDAAQSECIGDRLTAELTVLQLRKLARTSATLERGYGADPSRLTFDDLVWIAKNQEDKAVAPAVERAAAACRAPATPAQVAAAPIARPPTLPAPPPAGATPRAGAWLNLGAAATGQAISVDASSVDKTGARPQGWFRLTNPGASAPGNTAYLLRIDCAARTIATMAVRKLDASGGETERRDYGPDGEAPIAVEDGTVMEIAYLSLCT